jgi:hypothetical protein
VANGAMPPIISIHETGDAGKGFFRGFNTIEDFLGVVSEKAQKLQYQSINL